jgi:hypothetical protein
MHPSPPTIFSWNQSPSNPSTALHSLRHQPRKVTIRTLREVKDRVADAVVDAERGRVVGRLRRRDARVRVRQDRLRCGVDRGNAGRVVAPLRTPRALGRNLPVRLVDVRALGQDGVSRAGVGGWDVVTAGQRFSLE